MVFGMNTIIVYKWLLQSTSMTRAVFRRLAILAVITGLSPAFAQIPGPGIAQEGLDQIAAMIAEKRTRTPAESKLDSNLLFGMRAVVARQARQTKPRPAYVDAFVSENVAADDTVSVTIRATVSDGLLAALQALGAQEISAFPVYDSVTARLPIAELLTIAHRADVRFIVPTEKPVTNRYKPTPEDIQKRLERFPRLLQKIGTATSQGVIAHQANQVINSGIDGTGVFVCVRSDGIDSVPARQATGDLPPVIYVLAGQAGSGDEGTAMLEIIHDMAPGATLGFATAIPTEVQMASNIDSLRINGCQIIVDDLSFFRESAFQALADAP
jgi:hypothetical protein